MILFLCGDVMLGRGIDQALPHPASPELYEDYMRSAVDYLRLAEKANGAIPHPVDFAYVWGDAIGECGRMGAHVRIVNLETSITSDGTPWPAKGIHYRMHPANAPCLTAAGIDVCMLANNHVLDWGLPGLAETLDTLDGLGVRRAGAGRNLGEARAPALIDAGADGRAVVFGFGSRSSGIPPGWSAAPERPGLYVVEDRKDFIPELQHSLRALRRKGDIAVASIHWGPNWGYEIEGWQIGLAHRLIDEAGFDLVHGHSSHHVLGMEVWHGGLILYGCGDFVNDYEGIPGYEEFRPDLSLMYFPRWDPFTGALSGLRMTPMRMRRFQPRKASRDDGGWLANLLTREGYPFGTSVEQLRDGTLSLQWR